MRMSKLKESDAGYRRRVATERVIKAVVIALKRLVFPDALAP